MPGRRSLITLTIILISLVFSEYIFAGTIAHNVMDYGAKGDGVNVDTKAIQSAVDSAALKGGKVVLPAGVYLSGTIFLKSNVTIEISEGAVLLGSTNINDYPDTIPSLQSYNDAFLTQSLIYGDNLENISITGRGKIDGQGVAFKVTTKVKPDRYRNRPYVIRLIECKNILIENVTMINSAMWMQQYLACEYLTVSGIKVYNHANQNNDMIDIDGCRNVIISDCIGDTDDDALTFKSTSGRINENITVTNCILSSHVNAIKFGTESIGGFRNITISNIVIKPSEKEGTIYGVSKGIGGIVLELVDGGVLDGINISDVRIDGVQTPIFLRLGNRGRTVREGMKKPAAGIMKNISISNVSASGASDIGSSIHGIPGHYIQNISLDNINIEYSGGRSFKEVSEEVEEKIDEYPESDMFGALPSYGFYIRHAENVSLNNIRLSYRNDDSRPVLICDDVIDLNITGLKAMADMNSASFIELVNCVNSMIVNSYPSDEVKTYLHLKGEKTKNIKIDIFDKSDLKNKIKFSSGAEETELKIN